MTCRAPSSSTTCSGTPTGAVLAYDNEGRLSGWQNAPSAPTTTDSFLYDGEGNRVEQQTTTNGSIITSTVYVAGGLEEITSSGATTTLTKYFGANGLPTAERVGTNGPVSYLATDGQGTVSETLDGSGNVTSAQLYTPYGNVRYSSGSSPTSMGYTGQRADSATGLDYYHARYYDPAAGQFASADTVDDGLNRYGYVRGNPATYTDPSGHKLWAGGDSGGGGSNTPPDCHVTHTCKTSGGGGGNGCHSDRTCGCYSDCGGGKGGSGGGGSGKGGSGSGNTLSALQNVCSPSDRACLITAITNKLLSLIAAANFAVELATTLVAFGFVLADISQIADGDMLAFVNLVGDGSTALSGLVAVMKDGALLFGWGGDTFQEVLALLTTGAKALSAVANLARGIMGGLFWLSMVGNPMGLAKEALERIMSQIIKAIIGGFGFALTDSINGGVAAAQYALLTLKDTPTNQLPAICKFWGAQC